MSNREKDGQLTEEESKEILAELEHPVKDTPALKKQKERLAIVAALSEKAKKRGFKMPSLKKQKDQAYAERNRLVAALSKLFPASLEKHEGENWEDDWRWVVYIDLPTGQASWHIHDSELELFQHLERNMGRKWDGHSTEEKYKRLEQL